MRRSLRRRLFWALVILRLLLLALGATVVQAVDAAGDAVATRGSELCTLADAMRSLVPNRAVGPALAAARV